MEVSRGDLVTVALSGDYGKPRPALVIQADAFQTLSSVTVLRLTSELRDWPLFRITVAPTQDNGLRQLSQIMVDKAATLPREKIGHRIGHLDDGTMRQIDQALALFLGLPDARYSAAS